MVHIIRFLLSGSEPISLYILSILQCTREVQFFVLQIRKRKLGKKFKKFYCPFCSFPMKFERCLVHLSSVGDLFWAAEPK